MWRLAADPHTLSACSDAAGTVEVIDERRARVATRFGGAGGPAVEATVEWTDLRSPESLTVTVESTVAGMAVRLPARIVLRDAGGGATIVSWSADVEVMGVFAGLVAGLAGREAGRLIDGLVACVERVLASAPGA